MKQVQIQLTKTQTQADGSKKRVPTGITLEVPCFTIDDLREHSEAAAAWAEKAVEAAILTSARNAGEQSKVALDILTLITPATREGGAEALKAHREFVNALVAFLKTTGRKAGVIAIWSAMAGSAAAIATATQAARDGLVNQLEAFAAQLSEEEAVKYEAALTKLHSNLTGGNDVDEADFE